MEIVFFMVGAATRFVNYKRKKRKLLIKHTYHLPNHLPKKRNDKPEFSLIFEC